MKYFSRKVLLSGPTKSKDLMGRLPTYVAALQGEASTDFSMEFDVKFSLSLVVPVAHVNVLGCCNLAGEPLPRKFFFG